MGAVNSACGGCFGNTYDLTQTTMTMKPKQSKASIQDDLKNTSYVEEEENTNQEYSEQSKTMSRFSLTSKEFELIRVLVKGSFGKVCLVRRKADDGLFLLKILKTKDLYVKNYLSYAENNFLKDMEHPFILHLEDSYSDYSRVYLLTEFCPGGNLTQRIKNDGKIEPNIVKIYAAELVLAIQYIHENLNTLHKEINPDNILFAADDHIRLSGIGFSKSHVRGITRTGTPNYIAPESSSSLTQGPEADWWSLGCVIYFMLVGEHLFEHQKSNVFNEDASDNNLNLPTWFSSSLQDLLTQLLKRDPKERLGSNGAQEIKSHPFFEDLDWNIVLNKGFMYSLKLPIIEEDVSDYHLGAAERSSMEEYLSSKSCRNGETVTFTQYFDTKDSGN